MQIYGVGVGVGVGGGVGVGSGGGVGVGSGVGSLQARSPDVEAPMLCEHFPVALCVSVTSRGRRVPYFWHILEKRQAALECEWRFVKADERRRPA